MCEDQSGAQRRALHSDGVTGSSITCCGLLSVLLRIREMMQRGALANVSGRQTDRRHYSHCPPGPGGDSGKNGSSSAASPVPGARVPEAPWGEGF